MDITDIFDDLPQWQDQLQNFREIILANAVMFSEIPAPTFHEEQRVRFLCDRFTESGLQNISTDEAGNGAAILPGKTGERNILISAHVDTPFASGVDHSIAVHPDRLVGPGVGDNSLGIATLATLPTLLEKLNIQFDANLVLLGTVRSLGHGDLGGLRFFLDNNKVAIDSAVSLSGVHLGRLSYSSIGMLRGLIECHVPSEYDWTRFGASGAIVTINRVINDLLAIPLPKQPATSIVLGTINGGTAFNTTATHASLGFEVRSEASGMVSEVHEKISEIIERENYESHSSLTLDILARRSPGGIDFSHPMVRSARKIMEALRVKARIAPSTGDLSTLIAHGIPALTLGLTRGEKIHEFGETVFIEPIFTGLTQLIAMLKAIDGGLCDGQED